MATRRSTEPEGPRRRRPAATTPQARESQLISMAADLAERQLLEGTASAQVITHYLKLGSSRERLEQERLEREVELLAEKRIALQAQQATEEMFSRAIDAMRSYSGHTPPEDNPDDDY
jgi:hypothetical protein